MAKKPIPSENPRKSARAAKKKGTTAITYHVSGRITERQGGSGLSGLTVEAYDKDLRGEQLLGTANTDGQGRYKIAYTADRFNAAEKKSADLIIRVFGSDGAELGASSIVYNAPAETTIDLAVDLSAGPQASEYERILAELSPLLQDRPIADLKEKDISFLARETNIDQQHLTFLVQAARASSESGLPAAALYGFARQDLPIDLEQLLSHDPESLRTALERSVRQNIVPASLLDSLVEVVKHLQKLKRERTTLHKLATILHFDLPPTLLSHLTEHGIHTLADIRSAGGLKSLADLLVAADDPAVQLLEAHARLSVLPTDATVNARMIEAGYTSLNDIAETPRATFLAAVEKRVGGDAAAAVHAAAEVQLRYLTDVLTEARIGIANGTAKTYSAPLEAIVPQVCGCEDCQNAASPMAYLADLLDYATRHLKYGGNPVTLTLLQDHFHQPFRDLPATCELMDQRVRQVRICIEVLRRDLPAPYTSNTPQWYLESAYRMLLERIGTSYDEIRRARRGMKRADREALAHRLMILLPHSGSRPDSLDELFRDPNAPNAITELWLNDMFGLRDTNRDPLLPDVRPQIVIWRLAYLRDSWQEQDWSADSPLGDQPLIDPDIVGLADLKIRTPPATPRTGRPKSSWSAMDFWEDRSAWIATTVSELDTNRRNTNLRQLLDLLQTNVFGLGSTGMEGITYPELLAHRRQQETGHDISLWLQSVKLDVEAFEHLSYVVQLDDQAAPILNSEWDDFYSIVVQRIKQYVFFAVWRDEEKQAKLTLGPDHFRLRRETLAGGEQEWQPTPWRSRTAVRQKWVNRLQARIEQEQAVMDGVQEATSATEEALLAELRNALLSLAVLPGTMTPEKLAGFTQRLQIDCQAGVCEMTTRIAQAIETIQGVLFGARNGLLEDANFTLVADSFDEDWKWLGSYANWRAAIQVFLYPENFLRPTLRARQSCGFEAIVEGLRDLGQITTKDLDSVVDAYQTYFRDIASLTFAGLCQTVGLLPTAPGTVLPELGISPWYDAGDVFAVAQGGASGHYYISAWHRRPGWGLRGSPDQTLWCAIEKLPPQSELIGLLPYQSALDSGTIGMYFRVRQDGVYHYHFADFDGLPDCEAFVSGDFPLLVRTAQYANGIIPPSPRRLAEGVAAWALDPADQFCAADVDGNGREEIIVFSGRLDTNGNRRIGLLRERGGGLVLDQERLVPGGWRLPDATRPVLFQTGLLTRVLIVNAAGTQLATLGWTNGSLEILNAASQVAGAGGSWQVSLGTTDRPTTFVKARIDSGSPKLLVFEYADGDGAGLNDTAYGQTATLVSVFQWSNGRFTRLTGTAELKYPAPAIQKPTQGVYSVKWERFVTIPRAFGPQGALDHTEDDIVLLAKRNEQERHHHPEPHGPGFDSWDAVPVVSLALRSWDGTQFTFPPGNLNSNASEKVEPLNEGIEAWVLDDADYFVTIAPPAGKKLPRLPYMQELVIVSPTRKSLGVITITDAGLRVAWQASERLEPIVPLDPDWKIDPGDYLLPVDMNGDGQQEILIVNANAGRIGVLNLGLDFSLKVRNVIEPKVQPPGAQGAEGWPLHSTIRLLPADVDDDRYLELVAIAAEGNYSRLGVLRSVPDPRPRRLDGLPARFGPEQVTALDIYESPLLSGHKDRQAQIAAAYIANLPPGREHNLIYLDEAYYFVPMEIALRLRQNGQYTAALDWLRLIYDYGRLNDNPKIAYKLVLDAGQPDFTRPLSWLQDTLNPHAIAEVRKNCYIRYTLLTVVRCLLDYADAEFTRATSESIPRARELYLEALELLGIPEIAQGSNTCSDLIGSLQIQIGTDEETWVWDQIRKELAQIKSAPMLYETIETIRPIMSSDAPLIERYAAACSAIMAKIDKQKEPTFGEIVVSNTAARRAATSALLSDGAIAHSAELLGEHANNLMHLSGSYHDTTLQVAGHHEITPAPMLAFCIPVNGVIQSLRSRAELNLRKIRACQNIAGLELQVEPYALPAIEASAEALANSGQLPAFQFPTLRPLPYRYAVLIERAKQLVELARQIEASMLNFLEAADQKRYELLKARQDLALARAGVRLKDLQLVEAADGINLSDLQVDRARMQGEHYRDLIRNGLTTNEQATLVAQTLAVEHYHMDALMKEIATWGFGGIGEVAGALSATAQLFQMHASFERRQQDWQFGQQLADQDMRVGQEQRTIARDHLQVVGQERGLAVLQAEHAEAGLDFIANKFTNPDLYDWMSDVLQQVYRFFLQQATSIAQLAQAQLSFERQEVMSAFIQSDYWEPPSSELSADANPPVAGQSGSLRGLTGSARLLRDIYALDQYAFQTNQRKLQLTKTLSLAQLDPFAFQRFRETGVLVFSTPMDLFDRDFPGHYLRLIKRVRTSVIALIPPIQGIHATLSTLGTSRVVIGHDTFEKVVIQRGPESVALTSPINAAGLFELDPQPELLVPFEGIGVDTVWELRLPKAANRFDYDTLADVLITIEYTALNSFDYQQRVLQSLERQISADRSFSFRYDLADQWYDLHNPELLDEADQMVVRFRIELADFPANVDNLTVRQVVLYFVRKDNSALAIENVNLQFISDQDGQGGGDAKPVDGKISTRAGAWNSIIGKHVTGEWVLSLRPMENDPNKAQKLEALKTLFKSDKQNERIEDILLIVTYNGMVPPWLQ